MPIVILYKTFKTYLYMTSKFIWPAIVLLIILSACNKNEDTAIAANNNIDVSKQWFFDPTGFPLNTLPDDQWQTKTFTPQELSLFTSLDTTNLNGTSTPQSVINTPPGRIAPFPNPFNTVHAMVIQFNTGFTGQVVLKAVIVDSTMTPYFKVARRLNVQNAITAMQFSPPIPIGMFRFYYTLSSSASPHFYKSWGNIQKIQ